MNDLADNLDPLITLERAADMLGSISVKSVRRLISKGELPSAVKVLSRPTLPLSEVIAFIQKAKERRRNIGEK